MYVVFCTVKESSELGAIEFQDLPDLMKGLKDNLKGWITSVESIIYFDAEEDD